MSEETVGATVLTVTGSIGPLAIELCFTEDRYAFHAMLTPERILKGSKEFPNFRSRIRTACKIKSVFNRYKIEVN